MVIIDRREQIRRSLRTLADSYRAQMDLLERTQALLSEELAFEVPRQPHSGRPSDLFIDAALLSVVFRGKTCFLGNTLPFRFLSHLARRPNRYVSYDELKTSVWDGTRVSADAIRSVVKELRHKLRSAGLSDLASAIDG